MNQKQKAILWILLALLGIAGMGLCAYQMVVSYLLREYIRLAVFGVLGLVCIELTGTCIAKRIKQRKNRR